ncbi:spore germination protein GerPE [Paenibacillus protaetiae]|uniref:spore germination protein GerPE n=1 Tax=Paenibacillus protaetiae TaxID=2509456 RepID=UPI0013EA9B70|nr:spore germination protein GerPE [Paenibacillus protaetiae]
MIHPHKQPAGPNRTGYGNAAVSYPVRTAEVGGIYIIDLSLSGILQLGDHASATPLLRGLALQRETEHKSEQDVYFESYNIFDRPLPKLIDPIADSGMDVRILRTNRSPRISVGKIFITAMGASSIVQAGNGMRHTAESRIKHIRQFKRPLPYPGIGCP